MGGGGLQHFSVSPSPLVTYWVLKLIGSWLGLGLGGFGTKGLGTGLDNILLRNGCIFSLTAGDWQAAASDFVLVGKM